ncbi:MAG: amidase [Pirellulales bacterium]|nr:amidase [Pirellulales bacterium]
MPSATAIRQLAERVRHGSARAADLLAACLESIDRHEARIGAWVVVDRAGAQRAAEASDRRRAAGRSLGPMDGMPIGVKDLFDVAGLPTRSGSSLTSDAPAQRDANLVERLRAAGAVILGKTVTTEWACFDPSATANPWHPQATPGGSSSGSAAAVAAGMCWAALGSQTGGSITRPATFCGTSGLKPAWNELSLAGVCPVSYHLDHPGPIAVRVGELRDVFAALTGDAPADGSAASTPGQASSPPRIRWLKGFFWTAADATVQAHTAQAVERLRSAGAQVHEHPLPTMFDEVIPAHRTIMAVEAAGVHREHFPAQREWFGREVARLLDEGRAAAAVDFAVALEFQRDWRTAVDALTAAESCDALLTPATLSPAPLRRDTTGDPRFNSPWSLAGAPTVSLPCGLSSEGLPVGLQLIGSRRSTRALLDIAAWCETVLGFAAEPPT